MVRNVLPTVLDLERPALVWDVGHWSTRQKFHPNRTMAGEGSADDRMPDHFPRTVKPCAKVSETFFTCFFEKSAKRSDDDTECGALGLKACLQQKKAYEQCMARYDTRIKDPKRHRVRVVHPSFFLFWDANSRFHFFLTQSNIDRLTPGARGIPPKGVKCKVRTPPFCRVEGS